uniref:UBIQUITIN_CONJUGAT_2 domain-containing protein n=1 Tax=Macrostomum lignano TaxID=282301 RepID=A0A1I8FWP1_9PLAT
MSSRFVKEFNRLIKSIDKKFSGQASIRDYDADNLNCFIIELAPNNGPYKHGKFLFQLVSKAFRHHPDAVGSFNRLHQLVSRAFRHHPDAVGTFNRLHQIHASEQYPDSAPDVVCLTDIYHPNIDADLTLEHNICLNLFDEWNRTFGIEDCLQGLLFLLYHPNISDPVSSYFESGLDQATFIRNVGRSLRGEEVDGFTFQKNHGWAEHEAALALGFEPSPSLAASGSADGATATSDSNPSSDEAAGSGAAAVSALAALDRLAADPKTDESAAAYSTAPASTADILTASLGDCKMATKMEENSLDTTAAAASTNSEATPKENGDASATADFCTTSSDQAAAEDAAKPAEFDPLLPQTADGAAHPDVDYPRLLLDGTAMPATDLSEDVEEVDATATAAGASTALVDSGRPESPDSLSLASDCCLQDLLAQLQLEEAAALDGSDGDLVASAADSPLDFVCRRFRAAPDTSDEEDDEDEDEEELSEDLSSDEDEDDDNVIDDEVDDEDAGLYQLPRLLPGYPAIQSRGSQRYRRRRPDPAAVAASTAAAAAAASRRSLTVVARSSAPVVVRLRGGGMRSVQLLQVEASARYPGMLSISLNGRRLQPSLARLLLRHAARAFAESGCVWLSGGASPMTVGGGTDSASLLACLLLRHCLLPAPL